jgi:hypothetical protein
MNDEENDHASGRTPSGDRAERLEGSDRRVDDL